MIPGKQSGSVLQGMTPTRISKTFAVKGEVNTARLYICGLGLFEAYINGRKAGNDLLAPFINDYEEHFQVLHLRCDRSSELGK